MRSLLLLRHAKSSWDDSSLDDFDRPLNKRGRKAAPRVGAWIRKHDLVPDLVLCSAARRATETWDLVSHAIQERVETRVVRSLYLAEPDDILDLVQAQDDTVDRLLVVGHNPGFEELAGALAARGAARALSALGEKLPTGALVVLSFPGDGWAGVRPGTGRLQHFVRPRDLGG